MIQVCFTRYHEPLPPGRWRLLLAALPPEMRQRVGRYRRWQDRHGALFGRLLAHRALLAAGCRADAWRAWRLDGHGRPHVEGADVDFNLSHSDGLVVCALVHAGRVGIDVEKRRPLELAPFRPFLGETAWRRIAVSADRPRAFFEAWVQREAILKADGRGFSAAMERIIITGDRARLDGGTWHLRSLSLSHDHHCCLVSAHPIDRVRLWSLSPESHSWNEPGQDFDRLTDNQKNILPSKNP